VAELAFQELSKLAFGLLPANRRLHIGPMEIEALHVGMQVRHPQYGLGTVKTIGEHTAEIRFADGVRAVAPDTCGLEPAEAQVAITSLELPLATLIRQTVEALVKELGLALPDQLVQQLAARWHGGTLVLRPADPTLQSKEVPLEVFFHKIVLIRNNLRLLEQKLNAHKKLSEADKVELQQYITRCYGSLTTFNLLFRNKEDQFVGLSRTD
jgi:hypothetical protein